MHAAELPSGCGPARTGIVDEATGGLGDAVPHLSVSLAALGYKSLGLPRDPLLHAAFASPAVSAPSRRTRRARWPESLYGVQDEHATARFALSYAP